jgi:ABC-type polysaccharide/polyol phosphate transport system ATPase subunit
MSDIAVRVEGLSKQYRIRGPQGRWYRYNTIRDKLSEAARAPFIKAARLLRGEAYGAAGLDEAIWALKDVSFEVREGEAVGIIGRNGAGKSTLLKVLSRITEPTEGAVDLYGRVGSLLEVGTGFHPELTGRENIYLNGAILGMKRVEIDRKFDEIVAFSEIEKFLDTPVKHYSSGMYVRLAFSVAAHLEPEILVVDEVLAVGDVAFQKKCMGKMGNVAQEGRTVLFVSHNMDAVKKLCPRAMLLTDGYKETEGDTDEVVARYLRFGADQLSPMVPLPNGTSEAAGWGKALLFCAEDGSPQAQFRLNEPWKIGFDFELARPTDHVIAAVGLASFEGVPLITYWSKPRDLRPGQYRVQFGCDVPLKSCDIRFAVNISSYGRSFYRVRDVGHVAISEAAVGDQPFRARGGGILLSEQVADIVQVGSAPCKATI